MIWLVRTHILDFEAVVALNLGNGYLEIVVPKVRLPRCGENITIKDQIERILI